MDTINELMEQSHVGFGTSGARGLVTQMSDRICYSYTLGFIQHLIQSKQLNGAKQIAIGGDLRPSTPTIMTACSKAIVDSGFDVINCGLLASPAIALYGIEQGIPTIMVTGSHIPDDRNGIKFNTPLGEILKTDEQQIRTQQIIIPDGLFDSDACFINDDYTMPDENLQAQENYIQRYLNFFPEQALAGLRIGIYQHSGVARDQLYELTQKLGATAISLGRSEQFIPVDTEAIRSEDIKLAKQWVKEHQLDAIISTDGDADRPLISDEQGNWFRGDVAGILCAQYLAIDAIATPVSCNTALEKSQLFKQIERTRIGSPYVISGMIKLLTNPDIAKVGGYEANGGFLLANDIECEGRPLAKLPTRDAVIVLFGLIHQAKLKQQSLSSLADSLPKRFTYSDRLKEFPQAKSQKILQRYANNEAGKIKFQHDFAELQSKVIAIDNTDGVRFSMANSEIIHFRPSGNAPEFRCYSEADNMQRAEEINQYCLNKLKEL